MRQVDLARRSGVSEAMVGQVERGARVFGSDNFDAVADALNLSPDERKQLADAQDERRRRLKGEPIGAEGMDFNTSDFELSEEAVAKIRAIVADEIRKQQGR